MKQQSATRSGDIPAADASGMFQDDEGVLDPYWGELISRLRRCFLLEEVSHYRRCGGGIGCIGYFQEIQYGTQGALMLVHHCRLEA